MWNLPPPKLPGKLLFRAVSGSHAYGLAGPDSDVDVRGVYQLATESFLGLRQPNETVELPGDQTFWELRHFCQLCLRGNPNIIELLWLPERFILDSSPLMEELRALRGHFLSAQMSQAYLGWAKSKRMGLERVGAQAKPKTISHIVRLLFSLRRAFIERQLQVELAGDERATCLAIKQARWPADKGVALANELEQECRRLAEQTAWGPIDPAPVEELLTRARRDALN